MSLNFTLSDEHKEVKIAAREFATKEFTTNKAREYIEKEEFAWELYKKAAGLGFLRPHIPEEYGGQDMDFLSTILIHEEFVRADPTLGTSILSGPFGSHLLYEYGTEEQKKTYILRVLSGECTMFAAFTEPDHGSDILELSTTAIKDGDYYVINGVKTFITNAYTADFGLVLCQTEPEAKPTYRGQSILIVEKEAEGFEATPMKAKLGQRCTPLGELSFDNVKVHKTALVGTENRGFYHALRFFTVGRVRVAAYALGMAEGAFDRALKYAQERKQFGKPIIEFQAVSHKLAEMATMIEAAKFLTYRAAWAIDERRYTPRALALIASMAKNYTSEIASTVIDMAIQIFGGYGYMEEYDICRYWRDSRICRIYEGTTEVNNGVIIDALIRREYVL